MTLPEVTQLLPAQLSRSSLCGALQGCFRATLLNTEFCFIPHVILNVGSGTKSPRRGRVGACSPLRKDGRILTLFTWSCGQLRLCMHRCERDENISYLKKGFFKSRMFPDLKPVWFTSATI